MLDGVSKAEKLHALYETDILMAVGSDALVNMIYMVPGSCVLAIDHQLMSYSHLNAIAEQSQLFFLEVTNFSVPIPLLVLTRTAMSSSTSIRIAASKN